MATLDEDTESADDNTPTLSFFVLLALLAALLALGGAAAALLRRRRGKRRSAAARNSQRRHSGSSLSASRRGATSLRASGVNPTSPHGRARHSNERLQLSAQYAAAQNINQGFYGEISKIVGSEQQYNGDVANCLFFNFKRPSGTRRWRGRLRASRRCAVRR